VESGKFLQELRAVFYEELEESLPSIVAAFAVVQATPTPEAITDLFRGFHNLKGSSKVSSLEAMAQFTHSVDAVLGQIREQERGLAPDILQQLEHAVELLQQYSQQRESAEPQLEEFAMLLMQRYGLSSQATPAQHDQNTVLLSTTQSVPQGALWLQNIKPKK
jgi:chemotaxis protein histidine kinase CheA